MFLSGLTDEVAADMPAVLQDGLRRLATWLHASSFAQEAGFAEAAAMKAPSPSQWGPPPGWDMVIMGHRDFMTRRGGVIPAIISKVEDLYDDRGTDGSH
jgi:hypothetical protein